MSARDHRNTEGVSGRKATKQVYYTLTMDVQIFMKPLFLLTRKSMND